MREMISLNLGGESEVKKASPLETAPESLEHSLDDNLETVAEGISSEYGDGARIQERLQSVFPEASEEERQAISEELQTPEGRNRFKETVLKFLKNSRGAGLMAFSAELIGEIGIKVLVRQAIEVSAGATLMPAIAAGVITGVGVEVFYEVRKQKGRYRPDYLLSELIDEKDPVKRAALFSHLDDAIKQAKEDRDERLATELTNVQTDFRESLTEDSDNLRDERQGEPAELIKYLVDRDTIPPEMTERVAAIRESIRQSIMDNKLDRGKLAEATLKGLIIGIIGTTAAHGLIVAGHGIVEHLAKEAAHGLEIVAEKFFSETAYETGDRLTPKAIGKGIEHSVSKILSQFNLTS